MDIEGEREGEREGEEQIYDILLEDDHDVIDNLVELFQGVAVAPAPAPAEAIPTHDEYNREVARIARMTPEARAAEINAKYNREVARIAKMTPAARAALAAREKQAERTRMNRVAAYIKKTFSKLPLSAIDFEIAKLNNAGEVGIVSILRKFRKIKEDAALIKVKESEKRLQMFEGLHKAKNIETYKRLYRELYGDPELAAAIAIKDEADKEMAKQNSAYKSRVNKEHAEEERAAAAAARMQEKQAASKARGARAAARGMRRSVRSGNLARLAASSGFQAIGAPGSGSGAPGSGMATEGGRRKHKTRHAKRNKRTKRTTRKH
jgi:hypothetical protein